MYLPKFGKSNMHFNPRPDRVELSVCFEYSPPRHFEQYGVFLRRISVLNGLNLNVQTWIKQILFDKSKCKKSNFDRLLPQTPSRPLTSLAALKAVSSLSDMTQWSIEWRESRAGSGLFRFQFSTAFPRTTHNEGLPAAYPTFQLYYIPRVYFGGIKSDPNGQILLYCGRGSTNRHDTYEGKVQSPKKGLDSTERV